jgi:hypothetical protein
MKGVTYMEGGTWEELWENRDRWRGLGAGPHKVRASKREERRGGTEVGGGRIEYNKEEEDKEKE